MEKTFSEKIVWSNDLADVFDKYAVELDSLHLREKHAFRGADFQYCIDDCVNGNRYGLFAYAGNVAYAFQSSGRSRMYISQHDLDRGNGDEILGFFADSEAEACERAEHALRHYCEIVEEKLKRRGS